MRLKVIRLDEQDKEKYQKFLTHKSNWEHLVFYHTWEWGEFMHKTSVKFERVGVYDDEKLVGVGQFMLKKLKLGSFWYCPRGLVLDYSDQKLVKSSYSAVKDYFRNKDGAGFLRVDPDILRGEPTEKTLEGLGVKKAYIFSQAERVWIVELMNSEAEQLAWQKQNGMYKKVPYYLRKADREGVTVRSSDKPEDLEVLINMLNKLNERKGGIGKHPDNYYRDQFATMAPAGYERLFFAEKDGKVLASTLVAIYGKEASYLHAASTSEHRDLRASSIMQFYVMKYVKEHFPHTERYNMWGIVSDKNRKASHPRHGYSEFKRSFGGYKLEYIRARDFVYKPLIWRLAWYIDMYRTIRYKND